MLLMWYTSFATHTNKHTRWFRNTQTHTDTHIHTHTHTHTHHRQLQGHVEVLEHYKAKFETRLSKTVGKDVGALYASMKEHFNTENMLYKQVGDVVSPQQHLM